jgi:phospholipid/cholesterol/gamma-HCH transport system permease protein
MFLLTFLENTGCFLQLAARALVASPGALRRPNDLVRQLFQIYLGALPLSTVAGVSLGAIMWMHLHGVLARLGPGFADLLPQVLSLAVVLEFAPIGAGFIVAGRSGASLGAELGSMRLTEQIDALEVMGLSPLHHLVAPRVLACMITLPLLTIYIAALAIGGGYLAESLGGIMSWGEYWNDCLGALRLKDVLPATFKTLVFGFWTAVTGCYFGLNAQSGTEGVGQAATRSVVLSIFLVVVSDLVLVRAIMLLDL